MRVNAGLLGWGVFFIALGGVPLLVQGGLAEADLVGGAWRLWPLIPIGVGIRIALARNAAAVAGGGVLIALGAGTMAGGLLAVGIDSGGFAIGGCAGGTGGTPFADQRGTLDGGARVAIELDCGSLAIDTGPGRRWSVAGATDDGRPPSVEATTDSLSVRSRTRSGRPVGGDVGGNDWRITLPEASVASVQLTVNAGSAHARLAGLRLDRLTAAVNAGAARLDLSDATSLGGVDASVNAGSLAITLPATALRGNLSANAGSLAICVPERVDLRIDLQGNALASNNFGDAGLVEATGTWRSPDPAPGAPVMQLNAGANLGSITLNPDAGCG